MANRVRLAAISDIPSSTIQSFEIESQRIAVCVQDDEFIAFDDVCPHRGARLSRGEKTALSISCPLHHWEFNLATGICETDPALKLRKFRTFISEQDLYVELPEDDRSSHLPTVLDGLHHYLVRYGAMGWVGDFVTDATVNIEHKRKVVVETSRGLESGELLAKPRPVFDPAQESRQPAGRLIRLMNDTDDQQAADRTQDSLPELETCREQIVAKQLNLEVIDAELLWDGEAVVLYYMGNDISGAEQIANELSANAARRVILHSFLDDAPPSGNGTGDAGVGDAGKGGCGNCGCHAT